MTIVKSLFASILGSPRGMQRLHGWLTVIWAIVSVPAGVALGGNIAERGLVIMSLYAIVTGHWSAWQAARVEVKQDEAEAAAGEGTDQDEAEASSGQSDEGGASSVGRIL